MRRIEISPGQTFTDSRFSRRVVGLIESGGREFVVYSLGGDRLYRCLRKTFLEFRREAVEVTGCSIVLSDGGLIKEE
jgi:hypothetical protein